MISELILYPFFPLLKNFLQFSFFFSFFPHTSSVTTNDPKSFPLHPPSFPNVARRSIRHFWEKRIVRDHRQTTSENRTIERGHPRFPRDGAEEYSWGRLINLFRVVSPFLNDSMIKCHEFPEPRYIIHRERGRRFDSARRPLTVPQQR